MGHLCEFKRIYSGVIVAIVYIYIYTYISSRLYCKKYFMYPLGFFCILCTLWVLSYLIFLIYFYLVSYCLMSPYPILSYFILLYLFLSDLI